METDFVSEVDRKFFANNMLSNEDWEASMELTDLMGLDSHLPSVDFINDLHDDIQLPDPSTCPSFHDDLLNDWSDSSDSGVSGLLNTQSPDSVVKSEPLSPASPTLSHNSDSCDSAISQLADYGPYRYIVGDGSSADLSHDAPGEEISHNTPLNLVLPVSTVDLNKPMKHESPSQPSTTVITNCIQPSPDIHIDSILNSKIKIKPKPDSCTDPSSPKRPRTLSQDSTSSQKSLVLTADEFRRLTSQGLLRFQPPKQESIIKTQVLPSTVSVNNRCTQQQFIPVSSTNGMMSDEKDGKAFKRQQRMIKNRESASLSRKRKKEYMSSLEVRMQEFCDENERLKQENLSLKQKLLDLHSENESLKKTFTITPTLKKTIVLSFCLFFVLNLGTWSSVMLTTKADMKDKLSAPLVHKGRQLMAIPESEHQSWPKDSDTINKLHDLIMEYREPWVKEGNLTDVPPMCPTYFNKTESLRLAEQLAGWMYRHEEEKKKVVKKQEKRGKDKQLRPISTLRRAMRGDINPAVDRKYSRQFDSRYQIQLYEGADTGKDFLKALHRRNDTFYVLSFDMDYYLVPAVYHNKTSRPRMSLVMPAVALNESMMPSEDQVGMMQIDCEVMNTQLIHVRKSAIPRHAREKHNTTYTKYDKPDTFYPQ